MNIFPNVLTRVGGLPYEVMQGLSIHSDILMLKWENYQSLYQVYWQLKNDLNERLNAFIQAPSQYEYDYFLKKIAKNLRNDIYNERQLHLEKISNLERVPEALLEDIYHFQNISNELESLQNALQPILSKHILELRARLQTHSTSPILQNGLVLSAPSLLHRIRSYQRKSPLHFKKKEYQTERTLLQFLSRIATKTSPFSTFNSISSIKLSEKNNLFDHPRLASPKSYLRLNNYLFSFFKSLIINHSPTRLDILMSVNPTYHFKNQQHHFLTNSNNIEAFQQVDYHPVVAWLVERLENEQNTLEKILNELKKITESDFSELENFVFELYKIGLLEFEFGISGMQADWHQQLLVFLKQLPENELTIQLIEALKSLQSLLYHYPNATPQERFQLLQAELKTLQPLLKNSILEEKSSTEIFRKVNANFEFRTNNLIYEDSAATLNAMMEKGWVEHFTEKLDIFLKMMARVHGKSPEALHLEYFLKNELKIIGDIPLLDVYQKYAQWKIKNPNFKSEEGKNSVILWQNALKSIIQKAIQNIDNQIINITKEVLTQSLEQCKLQATPDAPQSKAVFVQFFQKNNQLNGVINASFPGYGKYFSRFLHLLDDEVTEQLLIENQSNDDFISAEIVDNSFFNANIHPSLMPFEVKIPNGNTTLPNHQQIPVNELFIKYKDHEKLRLFYQEKEIKTFDLGFQSLEGRSELFKLLNIFSPARFTPFHYLNDAINSLVEPVNGVLILPRITFENNIILQRKTWHIPTSLLPKPQNNGETTGDFFIKINQWRVQNQLPKQVFITIRPREIHGIDRTTDQHKPQFIDFDSPLFVELFGKNLQKVEKSLKVEEMLPSADDLIKMNNEHWVTEFLLQWRS